MGTKASMVTIFLSGGLSVLSLGWHPPENMPNIPIFQDLVYMVQDSKANPINSGTFRDLLYSYTKPEIQSFYRQTIAEDTDFSRISDGELLLFRSSIYAMHGYIFQHSYYKDLYESLSWYNPTTQAEAFDFSVLNKTEAECIARIDAEEASRGIVSNFNETSQEIEEEATISEEDATISEEET